MGTMRVVAVLLLLVGTAARAAELEPLVVIGTPMPDGAEAWERHVNFVVWLDDHAVAFAGEAGFVKCYDLAKKSERWSKAIDGKIRRLAAGEGNLFVLDERGTVHMLTAATGERVRQLDAKALATIAGADFVIPKHIAWLPVRNALVLTSFSREDDDNSLVLDGRTFRLIGRAKTGDYLRGVWPTLDGSHIVTTAGANRIRIWSIEQSREVLSLGDDQGIVIDGPFVSNAAFDGKSTLVYSVDNSWATGTVRVYDTTQKKEVARFDSRNGHVEMDVDAAWSRIALTGTSEALVLVGLDGRVHATRKDAAEQRIIAVKFSPDGKRVAVGSWDTTARVFDIKEDDAKPAVDGGNK
jgi:WD40 repeat protein